MKNCFLVVCFILLIMGCDPKSFLYKDTICITHINTIDAKKGLKEDMIVIIKESRIIKIVKSDAIQLSESNQIIDTNGKYLISGLWDAYVQFAYIEELTVLVESGLNPLETATLKPIEYFYGKRARTY